MNTKELILCAERYNKGDILVRETHAEITVTCKSNAGIYATHKRHIADEPIVSWCKAIRLYQQLDCGMKACVVDVSEINQSVRVVA